MNSRNETALFVLPQTYEVTSREILYDNAPGLLFEIPEDDSITRTNMRQFSNFDRSDLVLEAVAVIGEDTMLLYFGGRWIKIPIPKEEVMPGDRIVINYNYPKHPLLKEIESIELAKTRNTAAQTVIWQKD